MAAENVKFPSADAYPSWTVPVALAVAAPFFLLDLLGNSLRGVLASMAAASITVVFITLRQWRTTVAFWFALLLNAAVHWYLIWSVTAHHSDSHFAGVILAPLFIADFLVWQLLTVVCIRTLRI